MYTFTFFFILSTLISCHHVYGEDVHVNGELTERVDFIQDILFRLQDTVELQKYEIELQKSEIERQNFEIERQNSEIERQISEIKRQKLETRHQTEINEIQRGEIKKLTQICYQHDIQKPLTDKTIRSVQDESPVAFFAVKSHSEKAIADHTIVFDKEIINKGHSYNNYTGTFVAPRTGVYYFSWTIQSDANSYISTRLMVNGKQISAIFTDSEEIHDYHSSTGVAILELNIGESVYIKSHPTQGQNGGIFSTDIGRCTFSGYRIN